MRETDPRELNLAGPTIGVRERVVESNRGSDFRAGNSIARRAEVGQFASPSPSKTNRRFAEHNHWQIDGSESTIEHFKPQSARLLELVIGQIGNLILVPPKLNNEELGDKDVIAKKKVLKKAKFPIPDAMNNATTWGEAEIEAHTESLATLSYKTIE